VIDYRPATADDAPGVAALHADSWRRHYRGSYPDDYLDGDVDADRLAEWTARLSSPAPGDRTTVALDGAGRIVGLVHTILHEDPDWGALLDNLHVRADLKRQGIGARLMASSAEAVLASEPVTGLYLWVLERNRAAQAFYTRLGGVLGDGEPFDTPGGGRAVGIRVVWPDPSVLLGGPAA
jgi:ribosomal protein S18 acetylase RimI-like enzyme